MPRQFIREIARFEPRGSLIKSIQIFYQGIFRKLPTLFISYVEQLMEYQTKMKNSSLHKTDTTEPNTVRSPIPTSSFFIKSHGLYQFSKVLLYCPRQRLVSYTSRRTKICTTAFDTFMEQNSKTMGKMHRNFDI